MPFKLNQDHRHHVPRQKYRVTNSAAYDAALRQHGSLTAWFTDEAIAGWRAEPRTLLGGQPSYSSFRRNGFLLARRAQGLLETSAGTVLVATSLSLISLSVLLDLLR